MHEKLEKLLFVLMMEVFVLYLPVLYLYQRKPFATYLCANGKSTRIRRKTRRHREVFKCIVGFIGVEMRFACCRWSEVKFKRATVTLDI